MINLPNNGSIVILDDKYMEAEPLIKLLSKTISLFAIMMVNLKVYRWMALKKKRQD